MTSGIGIAKPQHCSDEPHKRTSRGEPMSVHNLPVRGPLPPTPAHEAAVADFTYAVPVEEQEGINWSRVMHALRRHKWLVLASTIVGTALGVVATRFVSPQYRVEATLWVDQLSRRGNADYT